jgi:hypothetical protein
VLAGTGTLFAVAEERFLVTAAHVAEDFIDGRSVLLTSNAPASRNLANINYDWARARGEFDVAVFRLGAQAMDALQGLTFLRLDDVEVEPERQDGLYLIYGFPKAWWKPDPQSMTVGVSPLSLIGADYTGSTSAWRFDEQFNVAIELADDAHLPPSQRQNVPASLKGISGCSVWWLRDAIRNPGQFRAEDAKVVAVQTGTHNRDSIVLATRWMAALVLIKQNCPDLAPALKLYTADEPSLVAPARLVPSRPR